MLSQVGEQGRLITPDKHVTFTFVSIIPANTSVYPSTSVQTQPHRRRLKWRTFVNKPNSNIFCLRFVKEMYLNLDIFHNMDTASFDTIVSVH